MINPWWIEPDRAKLPILTVLCITSYYITINLFIRLFEILTNKSKQQIHLFFIILLKQGNILNKYIKINVIVEQLKY